MDNTVAVALIGLAGTILGPVVTFLTTRPPGYWKRQPITRNDRNIISGKWEGYTKPEIGKYTSKDLFTSLNADAKSKTIKGSFTINYPETTGILSREENFDFQGGFLYDRFLQLNYVSTDSSKVQFGSIIFELSQDGDRHVLSGRYVGYGAISKCIIAGSVNLVRMGSV